MTAGTFSPARHRQRGRERRGALPSHWPLSLMFLGLPVWWVLGLAELMPLFLTVVMADQLLRRGRIWLPPGLVLWGLFLACAAIGVLVLWADAPGAVPGGGLDRLMVFGYKYIWYVACTVALLWVVTHDEDEVPAGLIRALVGYLFVVTVAGGLLGLVAPTLDFRSPLEMVLPGGLSGNSFVKGVIHPGVADIQDVLGRPEPRPKAPFAFANTWGSMIALTLPFFLVSWVQEGKRWQRILSPVVLVSAAVPIVYSLNRGLWTCLAVGALGLLLLQVKRGRWGAAVFGTGLLAAVLAAFLLSPLGDVFGDRLDNQHSNDRRGQLLNATVSAVAQASPVVGFGGTRDVQGSFASIAGASTPSCPACGVPPLGTQGHLWMVIFSHGFLGTALFLSFLVLCIGAAWRCRTPTETVCTFILGFLFLQLPVYDTLGLPLFVVMIAIALMFRERRLLGLRDAGAARTLEQLAHRLRRAVFLPVLLGLVGGGVAWASTTRAAPVYSATTSILLQPPPVYLTPEGSDEDSSEEVTIDTEAALVVSRGSLSSVLGTEDPAALRDLRERIRITAPPNTQVLNITVFAEEPDLARSEGTSVSMAYLGARAEFLATRRSLFLSKLRTQLTNLSGTVAALAAENTLGSELRTQQDIEERLLSQIVDVTTTPTSAGEVIARAQPRKERQQREIAVASGLAVGAASGVLLFLLLPWWRIPVRPTAPFLRTLRLKGRSQ